MSFNKKIESLFIQDGLSKEDILESYSSLRNDGITTDSFDIFKRKVQKIYLNISKKGAYDKSQVFSEDSEIAEINYTNKLGASKQKMMDKNRELSKENRETYRLFNAVHDLYNQLNKQFASFDFVSNTKNHKVTQISDYTAVLNISDLHLGEYIDLPINTFNYEVASQRLALLAEHTKRICKQYGVTNIVLAFTGDIINNDNHLSKLVLNIENRSRVVVQAAYILKEFILDLNTDFNLSLTAVVGNEGRIFYGKNDSLTQDESLVTNNMDYILFNMLKMMFAKAKGITFIGGSFFEKVISVNSHNILLTHGVEIPASNPEAKVHKIISAWSDRGIIVNYVIFGHIHNAMISSKFARSGGLPGANGYSTSKHLVGYASQNLILFGTKGDKLPFIIDLQEVSPVKGYSVLPIDDYYNVLEEKTTGKVVLEVRA